MKGKKGYGLKDIMPIALIFVVSIIGISIGGQILANIGTEQCETSYSWNTTTDRCELDNGSGFASGAGMSYAANTTYSGLDGLGTFGSWFPTIALVFAAALIIGVLVMSMDFQH